MCNKFLISSSLGIIFNAAPSWVICRQLCDRSNGYCYWPVCSVMSRDASDNYLPFCRHALVRRARTRARDAWLLQIYMLIQNI